MTFISSLKYLRFTDFIKCACDGNYSVLVICGHPTAEQTQEAWINLVSEYNELTGNKEAESEHELSGKIERLNAKINIVTAIVQTLAEQIAIGLDEAPDAGLLSELRSWGFNFPYTPATIDRNLQQVLGKLGNDKTKLAIMRKAYDDKQAEKETGVPTEAIYMSTLYAIEEKKKMELDIERLTAYKFAIEYKKLVDYNNLLKSKYSK